MAVLEGGLFLIAKGLGSLVSLAAVAKAEPCCPASPHCWGSMERQQCPRERAGRKSGGEALCMPCFCETYGIQLDKQ